MSDMKPIAPPRCPPCRSITDKIRIVLETNGTVVPEFGPEVQELLQPVEAPKPNIKFRLIEFPEEKVEELHEQVREELARSRQRESQHAKNPPPPDARAARLAELEAGIRADMRALGFVRIEIHPADDDPFDLFTTEE